MPVSRAALQDVADRFDRRLQQRDVVAERGAEAARLQEVALHVDDDERRPADVDLKRIRFGLDPDWHSIPRSRREELRKFGAKFPAIVCKTFGTAMTRYPIDSH